MKKDISPRERLLHVIRLVTSCILVIAAVLQYKNIWLDGFSLILPVLGLLQILDGILNWKKDRDQAAVSLFTACFIGLVCIGILFV